MISAAFVAFFGGALYEASAVAWVYYSERLDAWRAAVFSFVCATALVAGIGESVRDLRAAPFFCFGYAFGTWCAVEFNRRRK